MIKKAFKIGLILLSISILFGCPPQDPPESEQPPTSAPESPAVYTITASAGENGNISPTGDIKVNSGENQSFTITANDNYEISDIFIDNSSIGQIMSNYTFPDVTSDHSIYVTFSSTPTSTTTPTPNYIISANAGPNGIINPYGEVSINHGDYQTFNMTPNSGYQISDVLVDGASVGVTCL